MSGMLERKFCAFEQTVDVSDDMTIAGYASLFGKTDKGGDVVEPGAYTGSLERLKAASRRVKMLWQHDPAEPIGIWDDVREDDTGLYVKGRLLPDVARAREVAALLDAGAIEGLSIGYRTIRATKGDDGRRHLKELELWEVSLVTFPMLPEARVSAKGEDVLDEELRNVAESIEALRRTLGRTQANT